MGGNPASYALSAVSALEGATALNPLGSAGQSQVLDRLVGNGFANLLRVRVRNLAAQEVNAEGRHHGPMLADLGLYAGGTILRVTTAYPASPAAARTAPARSQGRESKPPGPRWIQAIRKQIAAAPTSPPSASLLRRVERATKIVRTTETGKTSSPIEAAATNAKATAAPATAQSQNRPQPARCMLES